MYTFRWLQLARLAFSVVSVPQGALVSARRAERCGEGFPAARELRPHR